jgi:hypothetical protein
MIQAYLQKKEVSVGAFRYKPNLVRNTLTPCQSNTKNIHYSKEIVVSYLE